VGAISAVAHCPELDQAGAMDQQAGHTVRAWSRAAAWLERARLASEDPLCQERLSAAEREWLRKTRPPAAAHWNLLSDPRPEALPCGIASLLLITAAVHLPRSRRTGSGSGTPDRTTCRTSGRAPSTPCTGSEPSRRDTRDARGRNKPRIAGARGTA